jgi:hypothetical protein
MDMVTRSHLQQMACQEEPADAEHLAEAAITALIPEIYGRR